MKLAALLLVGLLACAGKNAPDSSLTPKNYATVNISNENLQPIRFSTRYSYLGRVYPGQKDCLIIRDTSQPTEIYFKVDGKNYVTPRFDPLTQTGGWLLDIKMTPLYDALNLRPGERCK